MLKEQTHPHLAGTLIYLNPVYHNFAHLQPLLLNPNHILLSAIKSCPQSCLTYVGTEGYEVVQNADAQDLTDFLSLATEDHSLNGQLHLISRQSCWTASFMTRACADRATGLDG
jgi:hypothetical protein